MTRLSLLTAIGLSLSLSPMLVSTALAGGRQSSSRLPVHKVLGLRHSDDEASCRDRSLAAQASAGAFLEMTAAAP